MTFLICLAAVANLVAAALDCVSTVKHLSPDAELNPLAKRLMRFLGMRAAVYVCYSMIAGVTLAFTAACITTGSTIMTALCVFGLLLEAALHVLAARVNTAGFFGPHTGRVLMPVVKFYGAWERAWAKRERRRKERKD